jgi:plastocyanin
MSTDHVVVVGGPSLVFQPANITAQVGDTITFQFMQKNHTATQSSFANPCSPLSSGPGFDSGFMPVAAGATQFPTYTIQVNSTTPIWAYCKQANHCQSGMVFAVNAVETGQNNFENFVNNAKGASSSTNSTVTPAGNTAGSKSVMASGWATTMGVIFSVFVGSFWIMI